MRKLINRLKRYVHALTYFVLVGNLALVAIAIWTGQPEETILALSMSVMGWVSACIGLARDSPEKRNSEGK